MKENDLTRRFGSLIRKLRTEANLSQEDFAHICGLHRTYIGAIERGEKNVTLITAKRIANALQLDLSAIIQQLEDES